MIVASLQGAIGLSDRLSVIISRRAVEAAIKMHGSILLRVDLTGLHSLPAGQSAISTTIVTRSASGPTANCATEMARNPSPWASVFRQPTLPSWPSKRS